MVQQRFSPLGGIGAETNIRTGRPVDTESERKKRAAELEQVIEGSDALARKLLLPGGMDSIMLDKVVETLQVRVDALVQSDAICQALIAVLSSVGESVYSGADKARRELIARFGDEFAREFFSARRKPDTGTQG